MIHLDFGYLNLRTAIVGRNEAELIGTCFQEAPAGLCRRPSEAEVQLAWEAGIG
jgi:hypothetical protein